MMTENLLVELFVEELPPKSLKKLGECFAEVLAASLKAQGLAAQDAAVVVYATPRRLAVHVANVLPQAADQLLSQKLMPVAVGLNQDNSATPALQKKLASLGLTGLPELKRALDGKNWVLFYDSVVKGVTLADGLQKALDSAISRLPVAKLMSYQLQDGWSSVSFVRPAHGLVALHGKHIVPVRALGLISTRETLGHRFEAHSTPVCLNNADSYENQLEHEGAVIASFGKRREAIAAQLADAASACGMKHIVDEALLDEVTALVERPNVLTGQFEALFLEVPQECLILTMKANQKYFPLLDASGKLSNRFLIVSNIRPADPGLVIGGNERVVRPRLADAKFFYDQDRKKPLDARVLGLAKMVYHNKLGSQAERVERVQTIARAIGALWGGDSLSLQADQAALLAKADLQTDMVGEFPELQGIMGRYYALHDGYSTEIASAIEDHYKPRFAGDALPRNRIGLCVALADKLETLAGMFGIGQSPTGDKDPFALRRHALGIIRMLIEKELPLALDSLLLQAQAAFGSKIADPTKALADFIYERLAGMLREQGCSAQEVDAVLSKRPPVLAEIPKLIAAVRAFAALPEAAALAAANKRVGNILKKVEGELGATVDSALLQEDSERALHEALCAIAPKADAAFAAGEYTASLQYLAALRAPVDAFFDGVMVNVEEPKLRANRLALLSQLQQAMNRAADLARLA